MNIQSYQNYVQPNQITDHLLEFVLEEMNIEQKVDPLHMQAHIYKYPKINKCNMPYTNIITVHQN